MPAAAMSPERVLIHGPQLNDLTDFLYFDKVVYPTTLAYVRPTGLPPGYVGYPLPEAITLDVQDQLREAGLIKSPGSLIPQIDILNASTEESARWGEAMRQMADIATRVCDLPHDTREHAQAIAQFLSDIDRSTRYLAELASCQGGRTVAKYYAQDVDKVLRPGSNSVLSIIFSQFPAIDPARVKIKDFIEFLSDEETKMKRRRLFDWQNTLETAIEKGDLKTRDVPDRIAALLDDYTTWIKASGLSSKIGVGEILLTLGEAFIEGLTIVGIPKAIKTILELGKKKIELTKEELTAPGREIAFIAHCKRNFGV